MRDLLLTGVLLFVLQGEMANSFQTSPSLACENSQLGNFIRRNTEPIAREWSSFAQTMAPAHNDMSTLALRDHIEEILQFVADDIEAPQTSRQQTEKSHGDSPRESADHRNVAEVHASQRLADRFDIGQVVSEFRALRASVLKLWGAENHDLHITDLRDMIRFNEAIDETLAESVQYYTKTIDHSRNLFLGILGHDLRSPIGAASMCAQLMVDAGTLDEEESARASLIQRTTTRANKIVRDLIDLTRAGLGTELPVTKEHMDLGSLGEDVVREMQALNVGREIRLEIAGDVKGEWDKTRIGQVLSNLISNAIQYSFKNTSIEVVITGDPNEVSLSVGNDGLPIPPDKVGGIFDALTRGTENQGEGEAGSTNLGLGLYITRTIVSAHRGNISVKSSEKDGTRFTVKLPRLT